MKSRYICELDLAASIESNLNFLDKCIEDINKKKKRLNELKKPKIKNKLDLIDVIKEVLE